MQGYILRVQKVRDEDLLVFVLTPNLLVKSYRFFGARHSNIMTGYKIDFELEQEAKFLPKLRSILHLGFKWLLERDKLIIWQQFTFLSLIAAPNRCSYKTQNALSSKATSKF